MLMPCIVLKLCSRQKRDGRTDGRVNYYMPPFGGIKSHILPLLCNFLIYNALFSLHFYQKYGLNLQFKDYESAQ